MSENEWKLHFVRCFELESGYDLIDILEWITAQKNTTQDTIAQYRSNWMSKANRLQICERFKYSWNWQIFEQSWWLENVNITVNLHMNMNVKVNVHVNIESNRVEFEYLTELSAREFPCDKECQSTIHYGEQKLCDRNNLRRWWRFHRIIIWWNGTFYFACWADFPENFVHNPSIRTVPVSRTHFFFPLCDDLFCVTIGCPTLSLAQTSINK
jgi:hypothetical protein